MHDLNYLTKIYQAKLLLNISLIVFIVCFSQVVEGEASREALRKEINNLQRKMAEFQDESRLKEKDYHMALEDSRRSERRMEDQKRNLEIQLENVNAESGELRLKLSGSDGRVNALEAQLARLEGAKRDIEFKLNSIVSSLRRTIGFRQDMPRSRSPIRSRSPSPKRSRPTSPSKGRNRFRYAFFKCQL